MNLMKWDSVTHKLVKDKFIDWIHYDPSVITDFTVFFFESNEA
jgi:hypothetical protein